MATTDEIERALGHQFKALRLALDIDQQSLAGAANVSVGALKNLESGKGSTLRTIIRVARALDRDDWILTLHPEPEVSPMALLRAQQGQRRPQRASRRSR